MKRILALTLTICNLAFLCSCSGEPLTRSNLYFDTVCTVTIYTGGSKEVLDEAFEKLAAYDKLFDRYEGGTLGSLSETPTSVDPELIELVDDNLTYSTLTGGLFSPALGSLIDTWHIGEPETREAPDYAQIEKALAHIDASGIIIDKENQTIALKDPKLQIDLGATVKGYVAGKLAQFLEDNGVTSAVVDLGGNITLIGDKSGSPFTVGIDNPKDPKMLLGTLEAENTSIVTSGNYQRYFTDSEGKRYHHILDPRTGYPAENGLLQVVVIGENPLEDDFLSTALFIMGYDKAKVFLEENREFKKNCYLFVTDDTIYKSSELTTFTLEPEVSGYEIIDF